MRTHSKHTYTVKIKNEVVATYKQPSAVAKYLDGMIAGQNAHVDITYTDGDKTYSMTYLFIAQHGTLDERMAQLVKAAKQVETLCGTN